MNPQSYIKKMQQTRFSYGVDCYFYFFCFFKARKCLVCHEKFDKIASFGAVKTGYTGSHVKVFLNTVTAGFQMVLSQNTIKPKIPHRETKNLSTNADSSINTKKILLVRPNLAKKTFFWVAILHP